SHNLYSCQRTCEQASEKPAIDGTAREYPWGKRCAHITVIAQTTTGCTRARDRRIWPGRRGRPPALAKRRSLKQRDVLTARKHTMDRTIPCSQYRSKCMQYKRLQTIARSFLPCFRVRRHELLIVALVPHRIGHRK